MPARIETDCVSFHLSEWYGAETAEEIFDFVVRRLNEFDRIVLVDQEGKAWPFFSETVRAVMVSPAALGAVSEDLSGGARP